MGLGSLAHFGLALDDPAHYEAEHRVYLVKGDQRVLDDIVQQPGWGRWGVVGPDHTHGAGTKNGLPGDYRSLVHARASEYERHLHGVDDVWLAAPASLPQVCKVGHLQRHSPPVRPVR